MHLRPAGAGLRRDERVIGRAPGWWPEVHDANNTVLRRATVDTEAVIDGEWWRLITALTVHSGAAHLVGGQRQLHFPGDDH